MELEYKNNDLIKYKFATHGRSLRFPRGPHRRSGNMFRKES